MIRLRPKLVKVTAQSFVKLGVVVHYLNFAARNVQNAASTGSLSLYQDEFSSFAPAL